jgi:hypothetical protein
MTHAEVMAYARTHKLSTMLLFAATQDYAAARCLLLNGLFSGLVLGAQSIEKFLKAVILLDEPSFNARKLSHKIVDTYDLAAAKFPDLSRADFRGTVERFHDHYLTRYPDNPVTLQQRGTGELSDLDRLVVTINKVLPCPRNAKFRCGLYAAISTSRTHDGFLSSEERWIIYQNISLEPILAEIEMEFSSVMAELYAKPPPTT